MTLTPGPAAVGASLFAFVATVDWVAWESACDDMFAGIERHWRVVLTVIRSLGLGLFSGFFMGASFQAVASSPTSVWMLSVLLTLLCLLCMASRRRVRRIKLLSEESQKPSPFRTDSQTA